MGGKSDEQTVGYKYFVGIHMVLCHATADRITRSRVAKKTVFENARKNLLGSRSYVIDLPKLFGGEAREGGVSGTMTFQDGNSTQSTDSYLVTRVGADAPAFRGVSAMIFEQMYIGNNPYLKNWDFRVQRIHIAADDAVQWNDSKSAITFGTSTSVRLLAETDTFDYFQGDFGTAGFLFLINQGFSTGSGPFGNLLAGSDPGNFPSDGVTDPANGNWPGPGTIWESENQFSIRRTFTVSSPNAAIRIYGRIENGAQILVDGSIIGEENFTNPIDEKSIPLFDFTLNTLTAGEHTLVIKCKDEVPPVVDSDVYIAVRIDQQALEYEAMNPIHIIRECLTNKDWGMGYAESAMGTSFDEAADVIHDVEQIGLCMIWAKQESIEEFISRVKKHINAEVFVDRITGLFEIKLIRDDYVVSSLPVLDQTNVARISNFRRPAFGELVNAVTVTYYDMEISEVATVTVHDIALIQEQGNEIITTNQYPGFPNADLASRAAQRDLQVLSSPLISCTLFTNLISQNFNQGDVFVLNWPDYEISNVVMRVSSANYGNGKSNVVRLTCIQDVFTMPQVGMVPANPADWEQPQTIPLPVVTQVAFELPYLEAVQIGSQTATNQAIADNINVGYVGIAAKRPNGAINAIFHTNAGAGFDTAGALDFCPAAKLAVGIDRVIKTFDISDLDDVDEVVLGTWFQVDDELMSLESLSGTTITVKRGLLDTVPEVHANGAVILFWDNSSGQDPTEYVASDIVDVKITPVTGGGTLDINAALQSTVTLNSRAARPYPPGDVEIDGASFPTAGTGTMALTWASRNRLLQTSGIRVDWFDGDVTPEAGTTYTVRAIDDLGATEHETTGITDLFFTLPALDKSVAYTIEVTAVRDSLESFQPVRIVVSYTV